MKFGVVRFPGSNCELDCYETLTRVFGKNAVHLWHKEHDLQGADCIFLPGGFSYGDYLRAGAMASLSPIITEVVSFAKKGGLVIGICNGFQILTECGLLPGALIRNENLRFICKPQRLKVLNAGTSFTNKYQKDQVIDVPIAHGEGNYIIEDEKLDGLFEKEQVVFQYCDSDGNTNASTCPNGSMRSIAGIINKNGNVLGMMPHPERVCDSLIGGEDGRPFFESIIHSLS